MSHWTRRNFLRALGLGAGAALVTPLVRRVQAEGDGADVRRVVLCLMGNGIESHTLTSASASGTTAMGTPLEFDGDIATAPALGALAGQNGALDLRPHSAALLGLSSIITGGSHTTQYKALNCSRARAQTVDAWLARKLDPGLPFPALRLGTVESGATRLQYGMCLDSPSRQLPIIANPLQGHATVFGSLASGQAGQMFADNGVLLDFALQDVTRAIQGFGGGSREAQKLESYALALEEMRTLQQSLIDAEDTLRTVAGSNGIDPEDGTPLQSAHPLTRLEAQYRIATAALMGDLTRTVVLSCSTGNAFSHTKYSSLASIFEEDSNYDGTIPWRHGVCHGAGGNATYQKVLDRVIERQVEMIAKMARDLAAVPEGNGTMLDHTAIVFMSDNGSTHHSNARNWPMLVVGGSELGLRTGGRVLRYPSLGEAGNRRVSDVFSTLGQLAGYQGQDLHFGGEPDRREVVGPLAEILA